MCTNVAEGVGNRRKPNPAKRTEEPCKQAIFSGGKTEGERDCWPCYQEFFCSGSIEDPVLQRSTEPIFKRGDAKHSVAPAHQINHTSADENHHHRDDAHQQSSINGMQQRIRASVFLELQQHPAKQDDRKEIYGSLAELDPAEDLQHQNI